MAARMNSRQIAARNAADRAYADYQAARARFDGTEKQALVIAAAGETLLRAQKAARVIFYEPDTLAATVACLRAGGEG